MANPLLKKTESLLKKPEGSMNLIDIDYKLLEDPDDKFTTATRSMIEYNYNATLNALRMWLQSTKGDYIRESDIGGLFTYALNDKFMFAKTSEDAVASWLKSEAEAMFPAIEFISVDVEAVIHERNWNIKMVVRDRESGAIFAEEMNASADTASNGGVG